VHWVQIEVAADVSNFPEGVFAQKNVPAAYGRPGLNDYCRGAGKPEADGTGLGYDGPCPPFFDARRHYYRYQVLALDLETLDLDKHFTLEDFEKTAKGHVLATAEVVGRYTLNPRLRSA
jgi:ybhB and ybcL